MLHSFGSEIGPLTRSLLARDAKTNEELAHGVPESQMNASDISAMDAKEPPDADVTGLLQAWRGGDIDARDRLATVVYQELRRGAPPPPQPAPGGHTPAPPRRGA